MYFEWNENENSTYQNVWAATKSVFRRFQINNLSSHFKELEKESKWNPKYAEKQEIVKIRGYINKIKYGKIMDKTNEAEIKFFEKINNIDKNL